MPIRPSGTILPLFCLLLIASCTPSAPVTPASPVVAPGQWKSPVSGDTVRHFKMLMKRDSTERDLGLMEQSERTQVIDGRRMVIQIQGSPAFKWVDTMTMDAKTLAPHREVLTLGKRLVTLSYAGREITRVEQVGDSAPRTNVTTHPHAPFGFNQLDLLIRSIPLKQGYHAILPLYSEATDVLEMDTLDVQQAPEKGGHLWKLRFADPAIVSLLELDERTREIASYLTTPRSGAGLMRRIPVDQPGAGK